jgi:hypothetical protein
MTYRPAPKASWVAKDGWQVLTDNGSPIARFKGEMWEVNGGGSWRPLEVSGTVEVSGTETRFWSNGRWITVY